MTLTLTFINVVHMPIFKFGSQIAMFANIDFGIAPKLYEIQQNDSKPFKGE